MAWNCDKIVHQEFFVQQYGRKVLLPHEPKYILTNIGRLKVQLRDFSGWQKRKKATSAVHVCIVSTRYLCMHTQDTNQYKEHVFMRITV